MWTSAPPSSSAVTSCPVAAFTSGGPPMKIVPGPAHDHRLVRHRGHVRAAGRAGAHHRGDLRDPEGRQPSLVEEDPAEVVAIGEDLGLERQERAARVDEVETRQPVLARDLLGAEVLLHRQRVVRAALDGRVVRDEDALAALDDPDPGDDAGRGRIAVVEVPGGERVQLEERASRDRRAGRSALARSASPASGAARPPSRRRPAQRARYARGARRRAPPSTRAAARTSRRERPADVSTAIGGEPTAPTAAGGGRRTTTTRSGTNRSPSHAVDR